METVSLPPKITYIPNFITCEQEDFLLRKVYDSPRTKWTQLSNRRLQNWGGLPLPKGMIAEPIPSWLLTYMNKIKETGAFGVMSPNHCLVNEYLPGQGIMPHEDGNLFYPTVSTITLGSHGVLDFYKHISRSTNSPSDSKKEVTSLDDRYIGSLLLEARSLILVQEEMYTSYLHGIKEVTCDTLTESISNIAQTEHSVGKSLTRGTRVSLTIRHVSKAISGNKLFGKLNKK